jgi:hypothetical protein
MGGKDRLEGSGDTVEAVLNHLGAEHATLKLHLFDESGRPRRNIICLHRGMLVRSAQFGTHRVDPGDEIVLTNALAGG